MAITIDLNPGGMDHFDITFYFIYSCYPVIADPIIANFTGRALSHDILLPDF